MRSPLKKLNPLHQEPAFITMLLATICLLIFAWEEIFFRPNAFLLSSSGDGIKNIFGYLSFIHSDSWGHVTSQGYPYGDHVIYFDGLPALSYFLKSLKFLGIDLSQYSIGFFNALLIYSLIPTNILLYKILRRFEVSAWYACAFALLIGFMSPQMLRTFGHFSLGISFFVPLIWWLLLQNRSTLNYTWIFITIFFCGWLHPYFFLIGALFLLCFSITKFKVARTEAIVLSIIAILPLLLYKIIVASFEPEGLRHPYPYGFTAYHSSIESVFIPPRGPLNYAFAKYLNARPPIWEGIAYVGAVPIGIVLLSLLNFLRKSFSKTFPIPTWHFPAFRPYWLIATLVFVFSSAWIFKIFPSLVDFLGPLKNFRALGRFIWIFYYLFTIGAAILLFRWLKVLKPFLSGSIILASICLWTFETGLHYQEFLLKPIKSSTYPQSAFTGQKAAIEDVLTKTGYAINDFQAVLYLPYVHLGSEEIYIHRGPTFHMFQIAYCTGLPIATYFSSRSRLDESHKLLQMLSSDYINKPVLEDFDSRPILLISANKNDSSYFQDENRLTTIATALGKFASCTLFSLNPQDLAKTNHHQIAMRFGSINDSLNLAHNQGGLSSGADNFVWKTFDEKGGTGMYETGAWESKEKELILFEGQIPNAQEDSLYTTSLWVAMIPEIAAYPEFVYSQTMQDGRLEEWRKPIKDETEYNRGFIRVEIPFRLEHPENEIKITYVGKERKRVDNFVIQPIDCDLWGHSNSFIMHNNNFVPK